MFTSTKSILGNIVKSEISEIQIEKGSINNILYYGDKRDIEIMLDVDQKIKIEL